MNAKFDEVMAGRTAWRVTMQSQDKPTVVQVSSGQANWRTVFDALDAAGTSLSDAPVRGLDETDAIIAACLRYGSYFGALTCGLPYRWSNRESRVTNDEMKCINIEFSAALAQWWRDREQDPARVNRRVRAAVSLLATPWRTEQQRDQSYELLPDLDRYEMSDLELQLQTALDEMMAVNQINPEAAASVEQMLYRDVRDEANLAVADCWRSGPIEGYHAGIASPATDVLGYCRFGAQEVGKLMFHAANSLRVSLKEHNNRDARIQALRVEYDLHLPRRWSLTADTADIVYASDVDAAAVRAHLQAVSAHCPGVWK